MVIFPLLFLNSSSVLGFNFNFQENNKKEQNKQENKNRDDLIYALFQKNMYPTNPKVFEKLLPVILERDPQFFDKKKQIVQRSLERAKTPIQIYSALMGKGKEKE